MKLSAPRTLRVIEAIIRLRNFSQQKLSLDTGVSLGQVNSTVSFLSVKGFVDRTKKEYVLSDEMGLLKAISLFSDEKEDFSFLPEGESKRKIEIALTGGAKDIDNIFRTNEKKRIRIGIIGFGASGRNHYNVLSRMNDFEIVAIADITKKDVPHNIRFYKQYYELIGSEILDVVIVTSPSSTHHEIVSLALDHNLFVLCESPFTDSLKKMSELLDDEKVFVSYTEYFNPVISKLLDLIDEKVLYFDVTRQGPFPAEHRERNALFNLGIHDLLNAEILLGKIKPVSAIGTSMKGSSGKDAFRILVSAGSSIVSINVDWVTAVKERKYVIGFETKTVYADLIKQEIMVYEGNRRDREYTYDEQIKGVVSGSLKSVFVEKKEPLLIQYEFFVKFLKREKKILDEVKKQKSAYAHSYNVLQALLKMSDKQ